MGDGMKAAELVWDASQGAARQGVAKVYAKQTDRGLRGWSGAHAMGTTMGRGCRCLPGDAILHSSSAIAASATVQSHDAELQTFIALEGPIGHRQRRAVSGDSLTTASGRNVSHPAGAGRPSQDTTRGRDSRIRPLCLSIYRR